MVPGRAGREPESGFQLLHELVLVPFVDYIVVVLYV